MPSIFYLDNLIKDSNNRKINLLCFESVFLYVVTLRLIGDTNDVCAIYELNHVWLEDDKFKYDATLVSNKYPDLPTIESLSEYDNKNDKLKHKKSN